MAVDILEHVLGRGKTLDEALGATQSGARQRELEVRDRAVAGARSAVGFSMRWAKPAIF